MWLCLMIKAIWLSLPDTAAKLDKGAAKRFIRNALSDPVQKQNGKNKQEIQWSRNIQIPLPPIDNLRCISNSFGQSVSRIGISKVTTLEMFTLQKNHKIFAKIWFFFSLFLFCFSFWF